LHTKYLVIQHSNALWTPPIQPIYIIIIIITIIIIIVVVVVVVVVTISNQEEKERQFMTNAPQANTTFTVSESETHFFPRFHSHRLEVMGIFALSSHSFPKMRRLHEG
jgi:hypothetical protein